MPVEFLIPRSSQRNLNFDTKPERRAMLRVAKLMTRQFHNAEQHFLVIFNVQDPPMDMVIASEEGIGILDFKHFQEDVEGTFDEQWHYVNRSGYHSGVVQAGARHKNPFKQVRYYRKCLEEKLNQHANRISSLRHGARFGQKGVQLQGAVVPTGPQVKLPRVDKHHTWFTFEWTESVPEWAGSLTFGGRYLPINDLRMLLRAALHVEEYPEIEPYLKRVHGTISILQDNETVTLYTLDEDIVTIGVLHTRTVDNSWRACAYAGVR